MFYRNMLIWRKTENHIKRIQSVNSCSYRVVAKLDDRRRVETIQYLFNRHRWMVILSACSGVIARVVVVVVVVDIFRVRFVDLY